MAFIVGKKQDGKTYYYLAESARVGGRPRIVSQRYLGSAVEIAARLSEAGPGEPDRSRHLAFGDVAAVWQMLGRLRVAEIVDGVVGARRSDAGASVGTYIALATLNRVVDPCSKLAFSDWWDKTACGRWLRLSPGALDHRRFWEAMDAIDEARLQEIERRIVSAMVETFSIDLSGLVLDMTNFATWIDSANGRAPIAKRGHSKQKRSDLRIVGLGLVVSTDGGIPLVSRAYPGNKPDVTQFGAIVGELSPASQRSCPTVLTATVRASPSSTTPGRTPTTTTRPSTAHRFTSLARCRRLITPSCSPSRRTTTASSTRSASPALWRSRRERPSSAQSAALSSAAQTGSMPSSPGASTRPLQRPIVSSPPSRPASPGARPARPRRRWRPRSPASWPRAGWPGWCGPPSPVTTRPSCASALPPTTRPGPRSKRNCSASGSSSATRPLSKPRPHRSSPSTAPRRASRATSAR